jgi:predicted transcriptional regulator of viral defense system
MPRDQLLLKILDHAQKVHSFRPCHLRSLKNNMRTALCSYLYRKGRLKRVGRGKYAKL